VSQTGRLDGVSGPSKTMLLGRKLLRGIPFAASGAIHLALVASVLAVGARTAPRIEARIQAELIAPDAATPPPPTVTPRLKPSAKPPSPPAPSPIAPPRLVEATTSPAPPAREEEPLPAAREPPPRGPELSVEPPRPEAVRPAPPSEPAPDPARSPSVAGPAPGSSRSAAGLHALAETESPENLPAGVSMLGAIDRSSGGGASAGGVGGAASATTGSADRSITRTAIPRGGYQVQPRYPASARRRGIEGTTLLRVFVAADGRVTDVSVERTAGHEDLDGAAADAVRRWRFDPARRGDEPVGMWVLLPVEFRLK
jgi:periplasmic protein TonB